MISEVDGVEGDEGHAVDGPAGVVPVGLAEAAGQALMPSYTHTSNSGTAGAVATPLQGIASGIGKKKPPPPPPKKRFDSGQPPAEYVVALYDFASQQPGDLGFREGDRIKIIKKEGDASDSWWQGEVRGQRGSFPANYCQAA